MLKEVLTEKFVDTDLEVKTWQETARKGCDLLEAEELITPDFYQSILDVIEKYGPYMILVPKVCFFHGVPGPNVRRQCLSLVTLKEPVYFKEYDNQEIRCAFVFGAVDKDSHMQMIMELAKLLQDEEFIHMITNNAGKKEILEKISAIDEG